MHAVTRLRALLGISLFALAAPAVADEPVDVAGDDARVTVAFDQRPAMVYRFGDVAFKPYVEQLYTPGGVQVLRDAPHDHLHHHALMFALAADGVDFWSENPQCGKQTHTDRPQIAQSTVGGGCSGDLLWTTPDGARTLLRERRSIQTTRLTDPAVTLVDWRSALRPAEGSESVALSGSHYFGLGMRFVQSLDTGGRFYNSSDSEGEVVRGQERLIRATWCAYTAAVDGKRVTVAMFDHPDNRRHPAHFFTMTGHFAYLATTMNLWREPLTLTADAPLALRYGVALWDGTPTTEQVESVCQTWVKSP